MEVGRGESTDVREWPKISKEQDADKESYQFMLNRVQRGKDISKEREQQLQEVVKKYTSALMSWNHMKITLMQELGLLQKLRDELVDMKDGLEIERERELKLQREEHAFLETRNKEQN